MKIIWSRSRYKSSEHFLYFKFKQTYQFAVIHQCPTTTTKTTKANPNANPTTTTRTPKVTTTAATSNVPLTAVATKIVIKGTPSRVKVAISSKDHLATVGLSTNPDLKLVKINISPRAATTRDNPTTKVATTTTPTSSGLTISLKVAVNTTISPKVTTKVPVLKISRFLSRTTINSRPDLRLPTKNPPITRLPKTLRDLATTNTRSPPSSLSLRLPLLSLRTRQAPNL